MMKTLHELGPWPIIAAVAFLSGLALLRAWRARRRQKLAVLREVQRLQHEFAAREPIESQEHSRL